MCRRRIWLLGMVQMSLVGIGIIVDPPFFLLAPPGDTPGDTSCPPVRRMHQNHSVRRQYEVYHAISFPSPCTYGFNVKTLFAVVFGRILSSEGIRRRGISMVKALQLSPRPRTKSFICSTASGCPSCLCFPFYRNVLRIVRR